MGRENVEMALAGIFYGNTDLFDDTREGYTTGYFVTNVQVEPLKNNLLKININLDPSDILESQFIRQFNLLRKL